MGAKRSAQMEKALRMIFTEGKTAYAAAKATGLTQSAISQNKEYRAFIDAKRKNKE